MSDTNTQKTPVEMLELALHILKDRRPNTPGLGGPIHIIKQAIEMLQQPWISVADSPPDADGLYG